MAEKIRKSKYKLINKHLHLRDMHVFRRLAPYLFKYYLIYVNFFVLF